MKTMELKNLQSGDYVQSVRTGEVLEVVGMDTEAGKYMLSNGKVYSKSTIKRWFDVVEIPEVVEPDNTILDDIEQADELTSKQDTTADTEEQEDTDTTATSDLKDDNTQDDQLHEQQDTAVKKDIVEGNTATTNTAKTNTVQPTIQQDNLIQSLNNLIDLHGCYLEAKKEYIAVKKDGYKGTVCMIRNCRYGNGIHIDMKSKIWIALDEEYRQVVSKDHYTGIYDKTRKLFRIGYVRDLDILQVVILTALQLAS